MILISCRADFTSTVRFNQQDEILDGCRTITEPELLERIRGKKILVLIHGYNNELTEVVAEYARIQERMRASDLLSPNPGGYDLVLGYTWPAGSSALSFPVAVLWAKAAGERFRTTAERLQSAAASIDVQAHSLGARVALEALDRSEITLRNLWLLAPAIDDEAVEHGEAYYSSTQRCSRVYVLHSENDPVLRTGYRVADFPDFDRALGCRGPQRPEGIRAHSKNTKFADCKHVVHSHDGYRAAAETYQYWREELLHASAPQFSELAPKAVKCARSGRSGA
jgi:esterase/lipase superfamily enzyme